jgi:hypothetical protein
VERGVTEVGDLMLFVLIKVNAPTAVGSSALLGISIWSIANSILLMKSSVLGGNSITGLPNYGNKII